MAQKKKIIINGVNAANEIDSNNGIGIVNVTGEATKEKSRVNSAATGEQIWFSDSDLRMHSLIFGTTGSLMRK